MVVLLIYGAKVPYKFSITSNYLCLIGSIFTSCLPCTVKLCWCAMGIIGLTTATAKKHKSKCKLMKCSKRLTFAKVIRAEHTVQYSTYHTQEGREDNSTGTILYSILSIYHKRYFNKSFVFALCGVIIPTLLLLNIGPAANHWKLIECNKVIAITKLFVGIGHMKGLKKEI